jgi:hypothetical protein
LPAEQGVLYHQLPLGAGEVKGNVEDRDTVVGLRPSAESLLDGLEERPYRFRTEHREPLSLLVSAFGWSEAALTAFAGRFQRVYSDSKVLFSFGVCPGSVLLSKV